MFPTSIKEIQMLNGRLAVLNQFHSRSMNKCKSFFQDIKKNKAEFHWNEECEAAFHDLKKYLASPSLLSKLITGETLFLYFAI